MTIGTHYIEQRQEFDGRYLHQWRPAGERGLPFYVGLHCVKSARSSSRRYLGRH
jgi:hypothetical protein